MYDCYLTFRSITAAQRGAMVLERSGIRHQLARTPKKIAALGCGYSLLVRKADSAQAAAALRQASAPYSAVYRLSGDGELEVTGL